MAKNEDISNPVSQEDIEAADKLKNEANEYFKSKLFYKFVNLYYFCPNRIFMGHYSVACSATQ